MGMIKALIADNETDAPKRLSGLLAEAQGIVILERVTNPSKIESSIQRLKPDALFLDIDMPGCNGIQLLENIREYNDELPIVLISNESKYIADAINLHVFAYLLKPLNLFELFKTVERIKRLYNAKEPGAGHGKIKIPIKEGFVFLEVDEILCLEADGNYTKIITTNKETFVSSYNMGRLHKKLPGHKFYRINRGCFLNGKYLLKIDKKNNRCTARLNDFDMDMEVSHTFISNFNKLNS